MHNTCAGKIINIFEKCYFKFEQIKTKILPLCLTNSKTRKISHDSQLCSCSSYEVTLLVILYTHSSLEKFFKYY